MRVTLRSWVNPIWNNEISQCKVLIINSKTLVIKFIYIYRKKRWASLKLKIQPVFLSPITFHP